MTGTTMKYKPIVTLATSTTINDKAESVLIPKVLCLNEELKLVSECTGCAHHGGFPNQYAVACNKPEEKEGDKK
jgi:hypothetical protein